MYLKLKSVSVISMMCFLLSAPVLMSSTSSYKKNYNPSATTTTNVSGSVNTNAALVLKQAHSVYDSLRLKKFGLNKKAFEYAWKGYVYLLEKGKLANPAVLSICDFSQSSRRKRLYVINVKAMELIINTYVAHGRKSGGEYARSFSNKMESHMSSLGFYITRNTYWGDHGLALKIDGLEKGINDKADKRRIVVHGSDYVGDGFLRNNPFNGRSFGCPAVPARHTPKVINNIKNGSCLFIYHPSKNYINKSRILNS